MKKQILAALLVMGNLIVGCGGGDGGEAPKINNYTEWASLLKSAPNHGKTGDPMLTLEDGRTILGFEYNPSNFQGEIKSIVILPPSYSSNPEKFKTSRNQKQSIDIILDEKAESKPIAAQYIGNKSKYNKEKLQDMYDKIEVITFVRNGGNPVNIPGKVIETPKGEYWVEFSLIGSGEYLVNDSDLTTANSAYPQ